ncbi:MAG: hypothetical protein ABFE02_17325 [Sulfuricella sp.]
MNSADVRKAVTALVEGYHLDGAVRKLLVRAGLNKILIENADKTDPDSQKLLLAAAKQIADDPEVGLSPQQANMGVLVDLKDLAGLLANTKPLEGMATLVLPAVKEADETDNEQ